MRRTAQIKVPGGKLLQVRLEQEGGTIVEMEISGDFFLYPEEKLTDLENGLKGWWVNEDEKQLSARIEVLVVGNGITLVGFEPKDLARVIREALK